MGKIIKQKSFAQIRAERNKPTSKPSISGLRTGEGKARSQSSFADIREEVGGVAAARQSASKAKETFFRLAAKAAGEQPISKAPDLSLPPNLKDSGAPDSTGGFTGSFSEPPPKGGFFTPSEEEGVRRRVGTFGTENKAIVGGIIGVTALSTLASIFIAASAAAPTAVSAAARVGTRGLASELKLLDKYASLAATGTASKFAANTATKATTLNWLQRLMTSTNIVSKTNLATGKGITQAVTTTASAKGLVVAGTVGAGAGILVTSIGSYPFAGFIEEEALQTLGFAKNTAVANNDFEGADEATALNDEILNPGLWEQIKSAIPFANVLTKLEKFREAAALKNAIDKKHIQDLRIQAETGESDADMWARIRAERDENDKKKRVDDEAYYANVAAQKAEAKANERAEEEVYWANILANKEQDEQTYTSNEGDYYELYYQTLSESKRETPSKLNFGLL